MKRKDFLSFKGDISRGQLNHADPVELWADIINNISDEDLLAAKNILVVASGRCTEAIIIRDRLMKLGINKEEANARMTLVENDFWLAGLAEKKGFNVIEDDFIQWAKGTTMKFDIIVGNPPYQHPTSNSNKLWIKFSCVAIDMLAPNGIIAFITPSAWMTRDGKEVNNLKTRLMKSDLCYATRDIAPYFSGIGEKIGFWVAANNEEDGEIMYRETLNDEYEHRSWNNCRLAEEPHFPILDKVHSFGNVKFTDVCSNFGLPIHSEKGKEFLVNEQTADSIPLLYSMSQVVHCVHPDIKKYVGPKIVVNFAGHYYYAPNPDKYMRFTVNEVAGHNVLQVMVRNEEEARSALSFLRSKIYRVCVEKSKTSGFHYAELKKMPWLPLTHEYTDQELYELFGLTDEEIAYVESHVK